MIIAVNYTSHMILLSTADEDLLAALLEWGKLHLLSDNILLIAHGRGQFYNALSYLQSNYNAGNPAIEYLETVMDESWRG